MVVGGRQSGARLEGAGRGSFSRAGSGWFSFFGCEYDPEYAVVECYPGRPYSR